MLAMKIDEATDSHVFIIHAKKKKKTLSQLTFSLINNPEITGT